MTKTLNGPYEEDSLKDYIKDTKSEILFIINDLENEQPQTTKKKEN